MRRSCGGGAGSEAGRRCGTEYERGEAGTRDQAHQTSFLDRRRRRYDLMRLVLAVALAGLTPVCGWSSRGHSSMFAWGAWGFAWY